MDPATHLHRLRRWPCRHRRRLPRLRADAVSRRRPPRRTPPGVRACGRDDRRPAVRGAARHRRPDPRWARLGLGLSIMARLEPGARDPRGYGWSGGFGTVWANDPDADLVAIMCTQILAAPNESQLATDFWSATYDALER